MKEHFSKDLLHNSYNLQLFFRHTEITARYLFCRTFLENPEWSQKQETKRRWGAEVRFTVGLSRRCPLTAASGACQEVLFYLDGEKLQKWLRSFIKCSIANEHQIKCFHWKVGNVGKEKDIKLKFKNGAERAEVWPQNGPSTSLPLLTLCSWASFYRWRLRH